MDAQRQMQNSSLLEDNILVAGELPFQKPKSIVLPVNTEPLEDVVEVNVQSIRVMAKVLAEGQSEELL